MINRITKFLRRGKSNKPKRHRRRSFTEVQKKAMWHRQAGKCDSCSSDLDIRTVQYDHIIRWADGGETELSNGRGLCPNCHCEKTFKDNQKKHDK